MIAILQDKAGNPLRCRPKQKSPRPCHGSRADQTSLPPMK
ncbi:hypothetical protein L538_3049 [Bordetella hinzii 4161]|nr:hypothetical protein L538_3049 [Bordetella hinzii 4161]